MASDQDNVVLTITRNQMGALQAGMRDRFFRDTARQLRAHYPSATKRFSDSALFDFVSRHCRYAEHQGLTLQATARQFITIALMSRTDLAPPRRADLVAVLADSDQSHQWKKIEQLYQILGPRRPLGFNRWQGSISFGED